MKVEEDWRRSLQLKLITLCQLDALRVGEFVQLFAAKRIDKAQLYIETGQLADSILYVVEGLLRSYYLSPKGEEINKHFFLEGSFVAPLTSLVTAQPSPVNIACLETSTVLVANYQRVLQFYEKYPEFNKIGRVLVEYAWIGKERRETQLIMLDARQRYMEFLDEYPGLERRIPQYHIASYLGITPVQLSRIRSQKN